MKKLLLSVIFSLIVFVISSNAFAAYQSRFDAINFDPAVDSSDYFTVYGSQTQKAMQGSLGFYFDYSNRALEFRGTAGTTGRQSVLDHTFIMDVFGTLGLTDWFSVGVNMPFIPYSVFFTPDVAANSDDGGGMGDLRLVTKLRFLDVEKTHFGISLVPYVTFPTGDVVRFAGNGHVMGGVQLVLDTIIADRFSMAANVGYLMRDDVTETFVFSGGVTSTVRVDDLLTMGAGANFRFNKYIQAIVEAQANTVLYDFFGASNTTSFEADGGVRLFLGDSGLAVDLGGGAGLIEGVGTPRFRGFLGLRWLAPEAQDCPECAPDPRIQGNKIVLWGKIFFDTDRATIKPISFPVLDDVVDVLQKNPNITLVEIQGHADWRGSDAHNLDLTQRRAESSRQYLISKGVDPARLTAVGYGESRPIASNNTVEGMSQNRRVEFIIMGSSDGSYTNTTPDVNQQPVDSGMETNIPAPTPSVRDLTNEEIQQSEISVPEVQKVKTAPSTEKFEDDIPLSLGSYTSDL